MNIPRSQIGEYVLKGTYLALAYVLAATCEELWQLGLVLIAMIASFAVCVGFAARNDRGRKAASGNWLARGVLALLDHSLAAYCGVLAGLAIGVMWIGASPVFVVAVAAVGSAIGLGLVALVALRGRGRRWAIAAMLAASCAWWLIGPQQQFAGLALPQGFVTATVLAAAIAGFYLLVFAGRAEETELEVGLLCGGIVLALVQVQLPPLAQRIVVIVPLALFVVYCERVRKSLAIFKHIIRAMSYEQQRDLRESLRSYQLALRLNRRSDLAQAGNWRIHKKLDLASLADDKAMLELIDPLVCLDRARSLLAKRECSRDQTDEVQKLLDIVAYRRPDLPLTVGRERVAALLVEGEGAAALRLIQQWSAVSAPTIAALPDHEAEALYRMWCLALRDPQLAGTGGLDLLENTSARFSFLAVLERRLRQAPNDDTAVAFKPFLYDKITVADYETHSQQAPDDDLQWLDHRFCRSLGESLGNDQPERAVEYLRIAELGLPSERLAIWRAIALIRERQGSSEADSWRRRIKEHALSIGVARLAEHEREVFFETVRLLAERARHIGDADSTIENYQHYCESPKAGLSTLEALKSLQEQKGDVLLAIRPVEAALTYHLDEKTQGWWSSEKARLYEAVTPDALQARLAQAQRYFDFAYCYRRARQLFDRNAPLEAVVHYLDLAALGGERQLLNVNYLLGRTHNRAGHHADAAACFEQVRAHRPAKFADADQEEAYFTACRLLGDLYLDVLRQPEKAVACFLVYKDYVKSGADTMFKLGRAYESIGQRANARKWYDMVLVYPAHPKADDARQALDRLGPK